MDQILEISKALSTEEQKEFSDFILRNQRRKPGKILELFTLIAVEQITDRSVLLEKLYPEDRNLVAYHATRKRLLRELSDYIYHIQKRNDSSPESQIETQFQVARYLFNQNLEKIAWDYLQEAEALAQKNEAYLLLNTIYSFQIEKSSSEFAPALRQILERKELSMKLASEEDNAIIANQVIKHRLMEAMSAGKELNVQREVDTVLKQLKLNEAMALRPRVMYNLVSMVRSTFLVRKDFYALEPFLISRYAAVEERNSFNRYNNGIRIHLLYMIAHALYRNRKFDQASEYLEKMRIAMNDFQANNFYLHYSRYTLLQAAVLNYTNRTAEAIQVLKKYLEDKTTRTDKVNTFNIYLNLSTYYFQQGQYHSSIKVFQEIQHSDSWLAGLMGKEWVMKKTLVDCINQFEIGNADVVETRIRSLQRNFKELFDRDIYKRVQVFASLMQKLNNDPELASTDKFKKEVMSSLAFWEAEKEDLQAMTFYAWLKGRMTKRKYYDVLMDLVKR